MTPDRELLEAFLAEGRELLARAADDLAALARRPDDRAPLDSLFRALHTLKGSSGFFDLPSLTAMLHAAETRLEAARNAGAMGASDGGDITRALDLTDAWFEALEAGREPSDEVRRAGAALAERLAGAGGANGRAADPAPPAGAPPEWALALADRSGVSEAVVAVRYRPAPDAYFRGDDPVAILRDLPGLRALAMDLAAPASPDAPYDPYRCRLEATALCVASEADVRAVLRLVMDQVELATLARREPEPQAISSAAQNVRVSASRLDDVAALVDELVIAKNALDHATALLADDAVEHGRLRDLAQRRAALERVVADLHGAVTDLRLISLRGLFGRFPRQIREAAARLGKDVAFTTAGDDVTLDKSVVEALFEPLLHLLRNAIDHGVEAASARTAAGKPAQATVRLTGRASGDAVLIEVSDDGRGIDVDVVRNAAVARGAIDRAAADQLTGAEAASLVFAAGFSTAREVGEFSGRGVGMDSVRDAVLRLGGRVDLENRPGEGLTVRLTLPARMVLTRLLVVTVGDQRFGVPLDAVLETHRVRACEVSAIREGRAFVRRDAVIPILRLRDLLELGEGADNDVFPVLTLAGAGEAVGVQVDGLGTRLEAPLRPLSGLLSGFPGLLGSVLEGDGQVLLVLDLVELCA